MPRNHSESPILYQCIAPLLALFDIIVIFAVYWLALYLSFECDLKSIPAQTFEVYYKSIAVYLLPCLMLYRRAKMYNSIWQLISVNELYQFSFIVLFSACGYCTVMFFLNSQLPLRYFFIGGWFQLTILVPARFLFRLISRLYAHLSSGRQQKSGWIRTMLIGGGAAGKVILQEILDYPYNNRQVCCIIDDCPAKRNCNLEGIPIVGGRDRILASVKKYKISEIIFAIPSIRGKEKKKILEICKETGCKLRILPGIGQLINGEVCLAKMKDVSVEDLLGRDPIQVSTESVLKNLSGKVILVTGGGGSIGSELCRQIAAHHPKQLIIFDIYENNAYDIEQELKYNYPDLNLTVLIGSVRDTMRVMQVFSKNRPEIVFHAAAHKHVPLMESSPCESIKNNVMGTYKTAYAAMCFGCRRFLLISTDKAVNPTNIMGASKRLCEMVIQSMDQIRREKKFDLLPDLCHHADFLDIYPKGRLDNSRTEFIAVRFGNVLGSNGSVIPLFRKQLAAGGPLTVTHPDIIRYFMTIPEAVSLVLQAETFAKGGEIFVLDMGEPVKIDTLARNFIKLSGYKPDVDIKIKYTGLRPGEKLFEEKLMAEEGLERTDSNLIHIAHPLDFNIRELMESLKTLSELSYDSPEKILALVKKMVPTYQPKF